MIAHSLDVLKNTGRLMVLVAVVTSFQVGAGVAPALKAAPPLETLPATALAGPNTPLIGCGASANDSWTNTTGTYTTVRECELTVPDGGQVFISADATMVSSATVNQGEFDVSVDSTSSGLGAPRWVTIRDDGSGGQRLSVARTAMAPLGTGSHTIRFLGKSLSPPDAVRLEDASLSAIFVPDSSDLLTCHADDSEWATSSTAYVGILKCTLKAPEKGWAFVAADATARWQSLDQDLELAIGFDGVASPEGATRFVGAHTGTWSFSPAALSLLKPVDKGDRTFYLIGRRDQGTGQIDVYNPVLNVIYIPSSSAYAVACGSSDTELWSHGSGTWQGIANCSLASPTNAWAFVSASSSVNYSDNAYQGQFRANIGTAESTSRMVNIYSTDDFGKDNTVAASLLKPIKAGTHSFSIEGRRASGTGTMQFYRPTLTAIVALSTLEKPALTSPDDDAALCSGRPTFTWTGVEGATAHQIQVDDDHAFGSPAIEESVMGSSYAVGAAQELPEGEYYWRVRGSSPVQTGPWSGTRYFSVGPPRAKTTLVSPPDAHLFCASDTQDFEWNLGVRATGYDIQIDNDPGFTSPEIDDSTPGDLGYALTPALSPGTYSWHVRSTNPCGDGPWSDPRSVTVSSAPDAPTPLLPADGSATEDMTPTLSWSGVSGALTYFIKVSQDESFGTLVIDSFSATTSYTVPGSDALVKSTYYWKAGSEDSCGDGNWSTPWKLIVTSFDHQAHLPLVVR